MFRLIKFITLMSVLLSNVWALSSEHMKMPDQSKMKKVIRTALSPKTKKEVVSILEANEQLHTFFFKYDAKKVESSAKAVIQKIDSLTDAKISKLFQFSKQKLKDIKAGSSRDDNNKNFHLFSMVLIHIINTYDVGDKYNAYSCPMVKKKWVQNSKKMAKIHNPYAPGMPHCGSQDSHH